MLRKGTWSGRPSPGCLTTYNSDHSVRVGGWDTTLLLAFLMYLLLVLPRSSVPAVRPAPGPSTCPTFVQLLVLLKIVKCLHCTICHCFTNGDNVAHSPIVALGSIHCFTWYHFVHGAIVSHGAIVVLGAICSTWCHCCTVHALCHFAHGLLCMVT